MGTRQDSYRTTSVRRRRWVVGTVVLILLCGGAAFALTAFAPEVLDRSPARADQRFVAAVQSEGRSLAPGADEALVIQAAHKVCDGGHGATSSARRAGALTIEEIAAVRRTFGDDSPGFIDAAKRSYCPLSR